MLTFATYLQQLGVAISHNVAVGELAKPFSILSFVQLNGRSDTVDNVRDGDVVTYAHGLGRKLIFIFLLISIMYYLSGQILSTCFFSTKLSPHHFVLLFIFLLGPISESLCDLPVPSKFIIFGMVSVILVGLWIFVLLGINPLITPNISVYMLEGKGYSGIRPSRETNILCWGKQRAIAYREQKEREEEVN